MIAQFRGQRHRSWREKARTAPRAIDQFRMLRPRCGKEGGGEEEERKEGALREE